LPFKAHDKAPLLRVKSRHPQGQSQGRRGMLVGSRDGKGLGQVEKMGEHPDVARNQGSH